MPKNGKQIKQNSIAMQQKRLNRKLNWIEVKPYGTFLPNITVAGLFNAIFGRRCRCWGQLLKIRKVVCKVVYFCLIYIYIRLFWWSYIHALFFFWYIFTSKGELHSNYIFLYFALFGLEWDCITPFTKINFLFLPRLSPFPQNMCCLLFTNISIL